MKILQVIPYFYPAWRFGGPVRVAYDISRKLAERGHSVTVYTTDIQDENTRVKSSHRNVDGVDTYYFRNLSLYAASRKIFITPSLIFALKDNVKNFDVVHVHGNRTTQSPLLHYFLKKNSVPYVIQAHGGLPSASGRKLKQLYDLLFGYALLKDASKVVALTQTEAKQYLGMGVPKEEIAIIPNGINLSEYANPLPKGSFKRKFRMKEEEKTVLYLGRIHESKGLGMLAEAFSLVAKKIEDARLVLVGPDDGYASAFSTLATALGIREKVFLTGFVNKENKLAALIDSDVFVTPRFYGFPITFLEACVAGCPIVTTSDELDWIHDRVGFVTKNSASALADAIATILQDEATRERSRNNCKAMVRNFDMSKIVSQLEKVYEEASS